MKELQSKIEEWSKKNNDKMLHFIVGLLMSLFIVFSWWLLLLPIVAGIVKEIIDKYIRKTRFDMQDVFTTWFGAVPTVIVMIINEVIK